MYVEYVPNGIKVTQNSYKETLKEMNIEDPVDPSRRLTRREFKDFRGLVGKLNWLSEVSRPDLAFDTLDMASFTKDATVKQAQRLNKVVRKASELDNEILYSKIGDETDLKILAISDAALNKRENKTQSIMGKSVFLSNLAETKVCPIVLKSKTIQTVCRSAKDAETRGFEKTAEEAIYIARSLKEILTARTTAGHYGHGFTITDRLYKQYKTD